MITKIQETQMKKVFDGLTLEKAHQLLDEAINNHLAMINCSVHKHLEKYNIHDQTKNHNDCDFHVIAFVEVDEDEISVIRNQRNEVVINYQVKMIIKEDIKED